jgi:HTH-type transcriptional regulator, sugar sensing transcriptional regulator
MQLNKLRNIGLTDGEVRVYDALLSLGETTRTKLAKKSGVSPSKIYDVTNRLIEKGIISSIKKHGVLHFIPANPKRLHDFVEKKQADIQSEIKLVDSLIPNLLMKYNKTNEETDVEVFYGWEGMKTVYTDISNTLTKEDINYVFGASMGKDWKQADLFFSQYYAKVRKAGYSIHIIFNEDVRGHTARTTEYSKTPHKTRYLFSETFTELSVYKDTVLIVMLLKKPVVIRVKNKEAAESFKEFFKSMWKRAKP